jgi:hypothetical protein
LKNNFKNNHRNNNQNFSNKQQYNNNRKLNSNQNNYNPTEFDDTYRMRGINRQNNRKNDYNSNNNYVAQNRQQPNMRNDNRRNKFLEQTTYGTLCYNNSNNDKDENLHTIYGKNHNNDLYLKDKKSNKKDKLKKIAGFSALMTIVILFIIVLDKVGMINL